MNLLFGNKQDKTIPVIIAPKAVSVSAIKTISVELQMTWTMKSSPYEVCLQYSLYHDRLLIDHATICTLASCGMIFQI